MVISAKKDSECCFEKDSKEMKSFIKRIMDKMLWGISMIYPYQRSHKLWRYRNQLYSLWIRNFIGEIGEHSMICYPCSLQGDGQRRIKIGESTNIQGHCILGCWERYGEQRFTPTLTIGNQCSIGEYNHITTCNKITIGDGILTGRYVYIGDNAHGGLSQEEAQIPPAKRKLISKGEVVIGNNVWIGDKVTILGGVTIGDNVIIGANSVVTHDVPSNSIAAGSPAKVINHISC